MRIRDFDRYQELAARTLIPPDQMLIVDRQQLSLVQNTMGLVGEAGELVGTIMLEEDTTKESGDVAWYMAAIASVMQRPFSELFDADVGASLYVSQLSDGELPVMFLLAVTSFADAIKKSVFHAHGIDEAKVMHDLREIALMWYSLLIRANLYMSGILGANIQKLMERYPDGFTPDASVNRKDVK